LQALFDRLAIDPRSELFESDGMVQAGPDPVSEIVSAKMVPQKKIASIGIGKQFGRSRLMGHVWTAPF
jgi:hypothetical protein